MMTAKTRRMNEFKDENLKEVNAVQDSASQDGDVSATREKDLVLFWDIWLGTVRTIAKKKRVRISKRRYMATYKKILQLCGDCDVGPQTPEAVQPLHVSMTYLVKPWVTLESLEQADRSILRNLLSQCREVDKLLHPFRLHPSRRMLASALFLLMIIGGVFAVLEYELVMHFVQSTVTMMRRRLGLALATMTPNHWLSGLTILVVFLGAWMTRDMRSY